jgi:hypothetical protein
MARRSHVLACSWSCSNRPAEANTEGRRHPPTPMDGSTGFMASGSNEASALRLGGRRKIWEWI